MLSISDMPYLPILLLDFDGVCHSYQSGWKGPAVIPDPPVPGLFEFLTQALKHFDVQIYSSRSSQPGGTEAMKDWFLASYQQWLQGVIDSTPPDQIHLLPSLGDLPLPNRLKFPTEKPPAFLTIDDRAWCFTGQWPEISDLQNFTPWNKK